VIDLAAVQVPQGYIRAKAAEIEEELGPFPLIYADPPWKWGHFGEAAVDSLMDSR
jgi:hypothetical protein